MTSFTSEQARKAAAYLPRHPRTSFPFYVMAKPREWPWFYLEKWERKHSEHRIFLKANSAEELWLWLDMHGISRKHVLDATFPEDLVAFDKSMAYYKASMVSKKA